MPRLITLTLGALAAVAAGLATYLFIPLPPPLGVVAALLAFSYIGVGGLIKIPIGFRGVPTLLGGRMTESFEHTHSLPDGTERTVRLIRAAFESPEGLGWLPPRPLMGVEGVDCREQSTNIPPFEVVTMNNVRITVPSGAIRHRVVNPAQRLSVAPEVVARSLIELIQQEYRSRARRLDDAQLFDQTDNIREELQRSADDQATEWGIDVIAVLLGELKRPADVQADYERLAREERQRTAERIELEHVTEQLARLVAPPINLSREAAIELIQTERDKAKRVIDEKKITIAPESQEVFRQLAEAILARRAT